MKILRVFELCRSNPKLFGILNLKVHWLNVQISRPLTFCDENSCFIQSWMIGSWMLLSSKCTIRAFSRIPLTS